MLPAAQETWATWDGNTDADFIVYSSMTSLINSIWPLPTAPITPAPTPSPTTAAPTATFTYALWSQYYIEEECVDAHCHPEPYLYNLFAMTVNPANVCNAKYQSEMQDGATGLFSELCRLPWNSTTVSVEAPDCIGAIWPRVPRLGPVPTWVVGIVGSCWEPSSTADQIAAYCGDYNYIRIVPLLWRPLELWLVKSIGCGCCRHRRGLYICSKLRKERPHVI